MSAIVRRLRPALFGLGVMVWGGAAGCSPTAADGTTVVPGDVGPGDGPAPAGRQEGNSAAELESRLQGYAQRRRGLVEPAATDAGVCEDLCGLASSICEVKDKLCEISEERADQSDYRAMCREAQLECKDAQDSCVNCVESHASSSQPDAR